jgi:hypothetical protein
LPTGGFELRIVEPDGIEVVERFSDAAALAKRSHAVIDEVNNARWKVARGWNL